MKVITVLVFGILLVCSVLASGDGSSSSSSGGHGSSSSSSSGEHGSTSSSSTGDHKESGGDGDHHDLHIDDDEDHKVEIESKHSSSEGEALKFGIDTSDGRCTVILRYEDSNQEMKYRVRFDGIVEYREKNNQTGYQSGDEVASSLYFAENHVKWDNINCTSQNYGYLCTASTSDDQFAVKVHVVTQLSSVSGQSVRPTSAKIDVYINKLSRSANTRIALLTKLKSSESQEEKSESDEEKEGFSKSTEKQVSFGNTGFFSWVETATVNGNTVNVVNGYLTVSHDSDDGHDESSNEMTFSFDTLEQGPIVWDPKLAFVAGSVSTAWNVIPSVLMVFSALCALLL